MKFILFFLFIPITFSQVLETEGDKRFLKGNCEEIRKEVSHFSKDEIECSCEKEPCKIEITKYLPKRIQEMLKVNKTVHDGPNCWNSVLFSLGANQTLRFSQNEMDYWMRSPLCNKREGTPMPGDLVNVSYLRHDSSTLLAHTYQILSPNIAFNKTSPDKNHPYEVIQKDEYFDRYLFPSSCQYVDKETAQTNGCELVAEAFTCHNLDRALLSLDKKIQDDLLHLGQCAQSGAMGEILPWDDFLDMSKAVQLLATSKLEIPGIEETPPEIRALLNAHADESCMDCSAGVETNWQMYIPEIYFYASPEMKLEEFPPLMKQAIEVARNKKLYSKLSLEDKLMWTNVFLTGESLYGQFELLKYPD